MESAMVLGLGGAFCATAGTELASRMQADIERMKDCNRFDINPPDYVTARNQRTQDRKKIASIYSGKKIENTVPLWLGATQLRKVMLPPCFCTISRDTHSPSPVPTSCLVV